MQKLEKLGVLAGFDAEKLKAVASLRGAWWLDPLEVIRIHWPAGHKREYPLLQLRKLD